MKEFQGKIYIIQHKQKDGEFVNSNWDNIAGEASSIDPNESHNVWVLTGHYGFLSKEKLFEALEKVREANPNEIFRGVEVYYEYTFCTLYLKGGRND